ncbi:MAG: pilin [Patescibacteria group bacterium]
MAITKKHVLSFVFLAIFSVIQLVMFSLPARQVLADEGLFNSQSGMTEIGAVFGSSATEQTDLRTIIGRLINVVLGLLGSIFVILVIYAGFRYMTAAGNQDQTKKAVAQIRDAVIGLIIVLAAWAITTFIFRALYWSSGATSNVTY